MSNTSHRGGGLGGRRALVTGGTRGIGRAIATRLRADGASVVITGTKVREKNVDGFEYHAVDFSDSNQVDLFADQILRMDLDVLVNNAGINRIAHFGELEFNDFARIQQVNVTAPFLFCRAFVQSLGSKGWGRIINICSIFGVISKEMRASYSASKFALDGLTAALAAEVAARGVLANCVSPGFVETDMTRQILGQSGMAEIAAAVPIRRFARPDEIAALVAWLAGPENTYVSGQNIVIDGGFTRV